MGWEDQTTVKLSIPKRPAHRKRRLTPPLAYTGLVDHLIAAREDRVLRLTLNRPNHRNTFDSDLALALLRQFAAAEEDWTIGAVLLDARGPFFSAGIDLSCQCKGEFLRVLERICTHGIHATRPLIVAVQGPCLDLGVGLVAGAHIAVAAQGVQFGMTEIRYGSWPFVSYPAIASAIGARRATALAATGRIFSSTEALQMGLIHEITPPFELDDRATAIAHHLAQSSQDALRRGLQFTAEQIHMDDDAATRFGADLLADCCRTADFQEGVRAMQEDRKPEWPSLRSS